MLPVWIVLTLLPMLGRAERFSCRGRILGAYYADAKSGCKAFHVCVRVAGGGVRDFRFFCPPGTLFHQEAQTCTDWGDDDPLACPADLYDGQFDLYKIGSGFDTKKSSSPGPRDDEAEYGLQRAETGDRRLSQNNNIGSNGPASDLRAAHSSDFFSGQRDRGRDDSVPSSPPRPQPSSAPRQSFRRPTSPRSPPTTTQYTTQSPPSQTPPQSPNPQYDVPSKRKLVRKRPIYVSTAAPTTFAQTSPQQPFSQQPQQNHNQRIPQARPTTPQANIPQQYKDDDYQRIPQSKPVVSKPANVPPQYKDEYVEVSRVTPKQHPNRYFPNNPTSTPFPQPTLAQKFSKKEGLAELYNYDAQSTPGLAQKDNRPFKVRNSFSVSDIPGEDFVRTNSNSNSGRSTPTTADYNTATARGFATSTPAYKNYNSVSYDSEKNNFVSFSGTKQKYFNSPTTSIPTTTNYATTRSDPPLNFNTVAYNTNIALNTIQPSNYAETGEDDGQYRPSAVEDDGQYRPELYERELLSGAHSLNIAASGNRLPEDQKSYAKAQNVKSQTSVPRPFRPAAPSAAPVTTRAPEPTYTTTFRAPTVNTQRTFDYFQTYTTTSRPSEPSQSYTGPVNTAPPRPSTAPPLAPETRPRSRAPAPPTLAPSTAARPSTRAPHFSNPPAKKEDASYDYAYYDSDTGFSEYDHIEEFGKTKTRA